MSHTERILAFLQSHPDGHTTMDIVGKLFIPRPTVSKLLNQLVRQGLVEKKGRYPVYYQINGEINESSFNDVVGFDKSLKRQIISCKSSVSYPPKGLPVLILGDSGVGKSFLAQHIYHYAMETCTIESESPFKTLNCADYANNPELLSAALFGYVKGSFTGADSDQKGIFEEAQDGYLFLDEVHQLPPAGQEKLFRYLDHGVISKLGSQQEIPLNVRLIFATTNLPTTMLETFIRRIPVVIQLPRYSERPVDERFRIIYQLFLQEQQKIQREITVSANLFNMLLMFDGKGNIGTIKNLIKVVLANGIFQQKEAALLVNLANLPSHQYHYDLAYVFVQEPIVICHEKQTAPALIGEANFLSPELLEKITTELAKNRSTNYKLQEIIGEIIGLVEKIPVNEKNLQIFQVPINQVFEYMESHYGFQFSDRHSGFFGKLLASGILRENESPPDRLRYQKLLKRIKNKNYKVYKMTQIVLELLRINLDLRELPTSFSLLASFYILYHVKQSTATLPYLIIVSHGLSTASSISSLVNQVYGQYLFEGIDMPYHATKPEVLRKLKKRLQNINTAKGVLILVDMGSLLELIDDIQGEVLGEVAMINNITSQIALETANLVLQKMTLKQVSEQLEETIQTTIKYIPSKEINNLVLVACTTGQRSAEKIQGILKNCLSNQYLTYRCCDYLFLKDVTAREELIQQYNRSLIITTTPVDLPASLPLQELLSEKGEAVLRTFYKDYLSEKEVQQVLDKIIEAFTLENLIEQLTILNPTKLIKNVSQFVIELEKSLEKVYSSTEKKVILMHISIMIERLILENGRYNQAECKKELPKCNEKNWNSLKKQVSVIEKQYNILVNPREMNLLADLIF